jgi:recombination protein RecR
MIGKVPSLERLVGELAKLPGVGPKTAQRLAYHVLRSPKDYSKNLQSALAAVAENIHECDLCYSYTEDTRCHYCSDPGRRNDLLCVVKDPSDISRIESSGAFRGRYHVLHGVIAPLDGVGPEDLRLPTLISRLHSDVPQQKISEVILALDADLEGDTTVLYIAKQLRGRDIKVTRIAHGIPIGGHIDFVDYRTLGRALENRIEV